MDIKYKLTNFSEAGGCGCKLPPNILEDLIYDLPRASNPSIIADYSNNDDSAIYIEENNEKVIISSVDFISPITDDPFLFGAIATANSLSDIYAMGGVPSYALSILGWPIDKIPIEIGREVLKGAYEKCKEAGVSIAGGHSIKNSQPIFGLSVNGFGIKRNMRTNSMAKLGNLLYLTKPIGLGIYSTAEKKGLLNQVDKDEFFKTLLSLNNLGIQLGKLNYVSTFTDITGFGLIGHLLEICNASSLNAELYFNNIQLLTNLSFYLDKNIETSGGKRNWNSFGEHVSLLEPKAQIVLSDPQTNGGLLVAIDEKHKKIFENFLFLNGFENQVEPIGRLVTRVKKSPIITVHD